MSIITVASPDKISIAMFMSFMKKVQGPGWVVVESHSLMTPDDLGVMMDNMKSSGKDILLSFYARKLINVDPLKAIPEKVMDLSDLVVWMNLFSTEWLVQKDSGNISGSLVERWKMNMDRMNG